MRETEISRSAARRQRRGSGNVGGVGVLWEAVSRLHHFCQMCFYSVLALEIISLINPLHRAEWTKRTLFPITSQDWFFPPFQINPAAHSLHVHSLLKLTTSPESFSHLGLETNFPVWFIYWGIVNEQLVISFDGRLFFYFTINIESIMGDKKPEIRREDYCLDWSTQKCSGSQNNQPISQLLT